MALDTSLAPCVKDMTHAENTLNSTHSTASVAVTGALDHCTASVCKERNGGQKLLLLSGLVEQTQQHMHRHIYQWQSTRSDGWHQRHLEVAEQHLGLDVEHLNAVVHHLGGGALCLDVGVDVLVEVLH
jgi:hypothetical protein